MVHNLLPLYGSNVQGGIYDVHHVQNVNVLCTSCKKCNGLAFFHVYYVQTMYAAVTNHVGYNSKSLVAMDLWSKNHSLSSGYRPRTRMVLDHKSLATRLLLLRTCMCLHMYT